MKIDIFENCVYFQLINYCMSSINVICFAQVSLRHDRALSLRCPVATATATASRGCWARSATAASPGCHGNVALWAQRRGSQRVGPCASVRTGRFSLDSSRTGCPNRHRTPLRTHLPIIKY